MFLVPLSIITLEYLLALSAGLGLRCLRRILYVLHHHYQPLPEGARRVLILGAGLLGLTTAQDIRQYPHMSLVGFLDDDPTKDRRLMAGCRVLGNSANLEALCARYKVTDVVICAKSIYPDRGWNSIGVVRSSGSSSTYFPAWTGSFGVRAMGPCLRTRLFPMSDSEGFLICPIGVEKLPRRISCEHETGV